MLDYIFGKVSDVYPSYIVIETYGVGFKVNTPNPYSFELDSTIKVYLYKLPSNLYRIDYLRYTAARFLIHALLFSSKSASSSVSLHLQF